MAFDPVSPDANPLPLAKGTKIENAFMLSKYGRRYRRGLNEEPYQGRTPGELAIGAEMNGRVLAIPVSDLSQSKPKTPAPIGPSLRSSMPNDRASCTDRPGGLANLGRFIYAAALSMDSDYNRARRLVQDFHRTVCGSMRAGSVDMETEIAALRREWDEFRKRRAEDANHLPESAKASWLTALDKAYHLDMVARTVAYEGHPAGKLDGKPAEAVDACLVPEACAVHSCEQRIIALSIRNRAQSPDCKARGFACNFQGDIVGVATAPKQYNIWMPSMTVSRIAACDLRGNPADNAGKQAYVQMKTALDESARILYQSKDKWKIHANAGENLDQLTNYYHPRAMPPCDPANFNERYKIAAAYLQRTNDGKTEYDLSWNQTVILPEGLAANGSDLVPVLQMVKYGNAEKALRRERGEVNISYDFPKTDIPWRAPASQLRKMTGNTSCLPMGLAAYGANPNACAKPDGKQFYTAPSWGFTGPVKQTEFNCRLSGARMVRLGGTCDSRMQPIWGVK